ncbi:MAG: hypothetical protein EP326_09835 [Deltaproteobacteria bacterium]|nr:MAG: hypothetical protein EP326_09835 [Deltaproteobacteria bacterium]
MQLLTFAHRGEARAFLDQLDLTQVQGNTLYRFNRGLLLITGEGLFETMNAVSKVIATHPDINEIVNLGVAGSLDENLAKNEIIQIRTVYLELEEKAQFHSFSMQERITPFKKADCLTSTRRVLDKQTAEKLLPFASLVDRELWAICRAVKDEKIPVTSLKLISDIPSQEQNEICQVVKEQADLFSSHLFDAWNALHSSNDKSKLVLDELPHYEKFHFTSSMMMALEKKLSQVFIKFPGDSLESLIDFDSILSKETRPKEKAAELLNELNALLNPYRVTLEKRLSRLTPGLKAAGLNPTFDPNLEKVQLHIKGTFSSKNEMAKAIDQLQKFDFDQMSAILDGELDV